MLARPRLALFCSPCSPLCRLAACLALLLCACTSSTPSSQTADAAEAETDDGWLEVETPHFRLHTNLPEVRALLAGRWLEASRTALLAVGYPGNEGPPNQSDVVIFGQKYEFQDLVDNKQIAGMVATSSIGSVMVFPYDRRYGDALPHVIVHEMVHTLDRWFFPLQPVWLREGVASMLEGLELDMDAGVARFRGGSTAFLGAGYGTSHLLSIEELFATPQAIHASEGDSGRFYKSAWVLTLFLMHHYNREMNAFQGDLSRMVNWHDAWAKHFGHLSLSALNQQYLDYAAELTIQGLQARFELQELKPKVRKLSDAEGRGVVAWTAFRIGKYQLAQEEAAEALEADAREIRALLTRYYLAALQDQRPLMQQAAEQLVFSHPDSFEAWFVQEAGSASSPSAEAVQAARRFSTRPQALSVLVHGTLKNGNAEEALELSERLLRSAYPSPRALESYIRALAASQYCGEARDLVGRRGDVFDQECSVPSDAGSRPCHEFLLSVLSDACPRPQRAGG